MWELNTTLQSTENFIPEWILICSWDSQTVGWSFTGYIWSWQRWWYPAKLRKSSTSKVAESSQKSVNGLKAASSLSKWLVTSGEDSDLELNSTLIMDACMKRNHHQTLVPVLIRKPRYTEFAKESKMCHWEVSWEINSWEYLREIKKTQTIVSWSKNADRHTKMLSLLFLLMSFLKYASILFI